VGQALVVVAVAAVPVEVAEQAVTAPLFPANPPHTEGVAAGPTAITAVSKGPCLLQTKGEIGG